MSNLCGFSIGALPTFLVKAFLSESQGVALSAPVGFCCYQFHAQQAPEKHIQFEKTQKRRKRSSKKNLGTHVLNNRFAFSGNFTLKQLSEGRKKKRKKKLAKDVSECEDAADCHGDSY